MSTHWLSLLRSLKIAVQKISWVYISRQNCSTQSGLLSLDLLKMSDFFSGELHPLICLGELISFSQFFGWRHMRGYSKMGERGGEEKTARNLKIPQIPRWKKGG